LAGSRILGTQRKILAKGRSGEDARDTSSPLRWGGRDRNSCLIRHSFLSLDQLARGGWTIADPNFEPEGAIAYALRHLTQTARERAGRVIRMEVRKCPVLPAGSAIIRRQTIWTSIGEFVLEHDWRETPGSTASSLSVFSAREFTVARSAVHARPKSAMFVIFEALLQRRKRVSVRVCVAGPSARPCLWRGQALETRCHEPCA
jgi:hypothetical protein